MAVDEDRSFVYGPRLGSLYLLTDKQCEDTLLGRVLGLGGYTWCAALPDPTARVVHDLTTLKGSAAVQHPWGLCQAYRFFHVSRSVCSLHLVLRVLSRLARASARPGNVLSVPDIGRVVHGIEQHLGWADCYPRALITAYLCLRHGHPCDVTVGVLSPTRMLHAWCSADGLLPYEPMPEHYMYQPLVVTSLAPRPRRP